MSFVCTLAMIMTTIFSMLNPFILFLSRENEAQGGTLQKCEKKEKMENKTMQNYSPYGQAAL